MFFLLFFLAKILLIFIYCAHRSCLLIIRCDHAKRIVSPGEFNGVPDEKSPSGIYDLPAVTLPKFLMYVSNMVSFKNLICVKNRIPCLDGAIC